MKNMILVLFILVSGAGANAQGTLQFSAHMTSTQTDYTGDGIFSLTGNLFTYDVVTPAGFTFTEIHGPGPDSNAPLISSLQLTKCLISPNSPFKCYFQGSLTLTDPLIMELTSGQWYV